MSFIAITMLFVYIKVAIFYLRWKDAWNRIVKLSNLSRYWKNFKFSLFLLLFTDNINEVILEVHAGVGGLEAGLFAAEMFRMYQRWVSLLSDSDY